MNQISFTIVWLFLPFFLPSLILAACNNSSEEWKEFNNHCYKIVEGTDSCHEMGGKLASIHSLEEEKFLLNIVKEFDDAGFWLGLLLHRNSRNKDLISCSWTDGTPFDFGVCTMNSGKHPWAIGTSGPEPNNFVGDEDCVFIYGKENGWVDHTCEDENNNGLVLGYVCKK